MVKLRDIGEDALVGKLTGLLASDRSLLVGPGDDCAVADAVQSALGNSFHTLLKTDALVEQVHFFPTDNPRKIGWKSVARVISDFAAMGGNPEHFLITIALRANTPVAWAEEIYRGIADCLSQFGGHVAGGETTSVPENSAQMISVAATGRVMRERLVLRSTAQVGDRIFVTGKLGGSLAGKHLTFTPRLAEAAWLCEHFKPSAMMDLSDGLAKDLPRLAAASHCGFSLNQSSVPCTTGCDVSQALGDGEDFELLFTLDRSQAENVRSAWSEQFPELALTSIGEILPLSDETQTGCNNLTGGWEHFNSLGNQHH